MFSRFLFPTVVSPFGFGGINQSIGFFPGFGFGFGGINQNIGIVPGFGFGGINAIGSAISSQSLINTGTATGISQISTPTVIF